MDLNAAVLANSPSTLLQTVQAIIFVGTANSSFQQDANGLVTVNIGTSVVSVLPVQVFKAVPNESTGITFTQDGQVKVVTVDGWAVYFAMGTGNYTALQAALNPLNLLAGYAADLYGDLIVQNGSATSALPLAQGVYFSARPDIVAVPANVVNGTVNGVALGQQMPQLLGLPYTGQGVADFSVAYLFFQGADNQLMQQAMPPVPADWDSLRGAWEALGYTQVALEPNGILSYAQAGKIYKGIMGYIVTPGTAKGASVSFDASVGDVNGDGIGDLKVTYPNGDSQTLILLRSDEMGREPKPRLPAFLNLSFTT